MAGNVIGKYLAWRGKLAVGLGVLSTSLLPLQLKADSYPSLSCADALNQPPFTTAHEWLVSSVYAGHCFEFQARAVSIDAIGVRTLALSHRVRDGVRQQVVQHLDGPSVSVERRSIAGHLAWFPPSDSDSTSAPEAWAEHVAEHYEIALQDKTRVAERDAVELRFSPIDSQRYQHTWWIDQETGLLLKHVLSDAQGRVLETFQITQLHSPTAYSGELPSPADEQMLDQSWQVTWLPEGFIEQPLEPGQQSGQRVYSDGLAAVSVFVSPASQPSALQEGLHRIGVSTAAVSLIDVGDQSWQLVGIGELPVELLQRIVQSVQFE
ncbi:MucB/RseB C-terminal domain-containing protein [Halomonas sp. TD01]|uniref:MucB/RseB C-terminal domain-containing protein n=1 Tax=Halomonas sp. TD01 TaxID=999141 RepID=UPI000214EEE3|nr:MucB/RseB C-terminal domain-containing protein [Halomonas sp. TD01]EGP20908.1 negative regulator for alginate biosynthesis MucB [Halomonas sp. TD01]CAH1044259.1 Sigma factor RpoE negative regulatory protein RseB precursor [Halomonas sp. TD01]